MRKLRCRECGCVIVGDDDWDDDLCGACALGAPGPRSREGSRSTRGPPPCCGSCPAPDLLRERNEARAQVAALLRERDALLEAAIDRAEGREVSP